MDQDDSFDGQSSRHPNYFISMTDVMTAAALTILLFALLSFVQALDIAETKTSLSEELDRILSIKARIIQQIQETMNRAVGDEVVEVDPKDLTLRIREEIFFEWGKAELRPESARYLDGLSKAFREVLENEELRDYISVIMIEGHCDQTGNADVNWVLSSQRAVNVVRYLHRDRSLGTKYPSYFGAAGYSKFRPSGLAGNAITRENAEAVGLRDRRIEIRVILRDEALRRELDKYLGQL